VDKRISLEDAHWTEDHYKLALDQICEPAIYERRERRLKGLATTTLRRRLQDLEGEMGSLDAEQVPARINYLYELIQLYLIVLEERESNLEPCCGAQA
jgi:hypothetical protein